MISLRWFVLTVIRTGRRVIYFPLKFVPSKMASPPKDKDKELKAGHPPAGLWKLWNGFCGRLRGLHMPEEITLILPFFISSKSWGNEDHLKTSSISSPSSYSRRESRRRRICRAKGKVSERNEKLSRVSCCTLLILQRKVHIVYCAQQSDKWSPFSAYILHLEMGCHREGLGIPSVIVFSMIIGT